MSTPGTEPPVGAVAFVACPECDRADPGDYDLDDWHGCGYCNDEPLGPPERCNGSSVCVALVHTEGCYGSPPPPENGAGLDMPMAIRALVLMLPADVYDEFVDHMSDLSVLVQMPDIYELAVIARRACMVLGPEHVPAGHWETLANWVDALEATEGDA